MKVIFTRLALFVVSYVFYPSYGQETLETVTTRGYTTDQTIELLNGGKVKNWKFTVDGSTMGYFDPLTVFGNLDGAAHVLSDGAIRFDRSSDNYESGSSSSLIWVYPPSGIPYIRRYGHDFTILKIWSPTSSRNAYESTLALVNGDNEEEYLDLYNLNYPSSRNFGIRMQKRGTGQYKPFRFEYSNGTVTYPVFTINPDSSANFTGSLSIGGTAATGYQLSVAGPMIASQVRIKNVSNWPDYVFRPSYKRLALPLLEKFVQNNNHLPDIPSAQKIASEGIDVTDMQAKLLKKVEEITLYLIDQQKEIEGLKKQNKKLEAIVSKFKKPKS